AVGDGDGDFSDVADLAGEVGGHRVHVVGEVLPGTRDAGHRRLTAELALGADLARHARHFRRERAELLDHGVDGLFQFQNLASYGDGDLLGQVTVGDGDGHLGNVADLRGEIRCHRVHVVGEVLPGAGHTFDLSLAAELALGADLARHATHFGGKAVELVHHGVDRVLQGQDLAAHGDRDFLGQVAVGNGRGDLGDVPNLRGQVGGHRVDRVGEVLPGAG